MKLGNLWIEYPNPKGRTIRFVPSQTLQVVQYDPFRIELLIVSTELINLWIDNTLADPSGSEGPGIHIGLSSLQYLQWNRELNPGFTAGPWFGRSGAFDSPTIAIIESFEVPKLLQVPTLSERK